MGSAFGIDLNQPRVVAMIEVDSGQLGVDSAMAELQQLQNALTTPSAIIWWPLSRSRKWWC